ncbi:Uncharacterized protein APZ42_018242 [Daphnia magna]|uniref:Uncharacterized protein n=1 Tax=Daphnia magna TaxID=35525 RepID=A0A162CI45_9CRUS|nr:Uncharacterized protein APZ42_018242 [Daphnia magna]
MMVARCEVKESVFRPPVSTEFETETLLPLETDSLSQTTVDETRTIDETIAQLNETIEEIRSLDVIRPEAESERNGTNPTPIQAPVTKMDMGNPSASSSPYPVKIDKPSGIYPGLAHSKSGSKIPENRFVIREIRPFGSVQEALTFFQSTASSEMTRSTGGRLAEAPEIKSVNHQSQRLRETTKLLVEGHPQLRADLSINARLSQTNETNPNVGRHVNQNGDVATLEMIQTSKTSPEQKRRQSFVMTSGVEHHAVEPTIPVVHHKPSESTEMRDDASVEELMSKFDATIDEALSDN